MNVTGNKAKLFWTGGWDSTFEFCRLSLKPIKVQPVYIIIDRPYHVGEQLEIEAQNKILKLLKERSTTKAEILPLIRIRYNEIHIHKIVNDAFMHYRKTLDSIGWQYLYMGGYAYNNPGMRVMIGDFAHSTGRTMKYIRQGNFKFDDENVGYMIEEGSDPNSYALFGRMYYPIAGFQQDYILQWLKDNPFDDIMKHVWTCFYPIDGKPCGFCQPCRIKIKQHLDFFFTKEALKRGFVYNYLHDKYEFKDPRLDIYYLVWLRNKYNPEYISMNVDGKNVGNAIHYFKWFKSLFTPEYLKNVYEYESFFNELLNSDIEYRNMLDRGQEWGLT